MVSRAGAPSAFPSRTCASRAARMAAESFDACIVGSGAGGGAAAWALAQAGLRVVVLERGPHYAEKDFFHDELAVCRRDLFVPDPARDPHIVSRDGGAPERSAE